MFEIIFDFLLEPGLVTGGILLLPALGLLLLGTRLSGAPRPTMTRLVVAWLAGAVVGLLVLLGLETVAVLRGEPGWADAAWLAVGLAGAAVIAAVLRLRWHALWVGAGIALSGWLVHTYITAALLFE